MGSPKSISTPQTLTTAVFVDAGYLFAAGGTALFGSFRNRKGLLLKEPDDLVRSMLNLGNDQIGQSLNLLRTYWYDGAVDGIPTPELKTISALPRFKIRLGRLSGGGQKGVDGLIILDLINLSLNRVLDVAILLSGDEDLRETVLFAQGHGVTVVVAGIPETEKSKQSDTLVREADFHLMLPVELLEKHILETQAPLLAVTPVVELDLLVDVESIPMDVKGEIDLDDDALESLAVVMVARADFVVEVSGNRTRLSNVSDRMLIRQLITMTNTNPVADPVLKRARAKCVEVASRK